MNNIKIGQGTFMTICPHCKMQVLSGLLISHMNSNECKKKAEENKIEELQRKIRELEEKGSEIK